MKREKQKKIWWVVNSGNGHKNPWDPSEKVRETMVGDCICLLCPSQYKGTWCIDASVSLGFRRVLKRMLLASGSTIGLLRESQPTYWAYQWTLVPLTSGPLAALVFAICASDFWGELISWRYCSGSLHEGRACIFTRICTVVIIMPLLPIGTGGIKS